MAKAGDHWAITLGVEEEFFLIDPDTRDLLADPDPGIFAACERHSGRHKVVPEFLRSQIETNTRICSTVADVREALVERFRSIPDAHWQDRGSWVSGGSGVSEWTLTGTTAKGEKLELLGCDLWKFRGGKVVRKDTYWKQIDREFT